ncbi:MFS transporter [Microbispora sp. H10830]|uniref:MFS transporter n=1 Tax=Microbispora sp. H10830 TaxID=2729109 RepID=UPI0015FFA3F7|nr:MFS transporter [Microbispora sp. H10830]
MPVLEDTVATTAYRRRWAALLALLVAEAMNLLDATITTVVAPVIHGDFGGAESDIQWFSAAYTLPFAVLLVPGGRLGDLVGRKRVFAAGVALFALASAICACATGPGSLITTRAVQGAAAALIIPQTIGLIRTMFEGDELAKAMGSIGPVMGLAAVCGPVLGAVLTRVDLFGLSWRAAFLVNVPLAAVVLAIAPALRESRSPHPPRIDLPGTGLAVLGTGLIVYPLIQGDAAGWPAWVWIALAAGVVVLAVLGWHQRHRARRGRSPLIEPSLFRDRAFPAALATSTLFFSVMNGLMVAIVLQVQLGLGSDVLTAGLTLLPWSAAMAVASWYAGARLVPRHGAKIMLVGLAALFAGLVCAVAVYRAAPADGYPWPLLAALSLSGAGNGLFTVPFFTTALSRVRAHETGSAAGLLNAVQQFGGTLGVAVLGTAFLHRFTADVRSHVDAGSAALGAIQLTLWIAVALVAVTAVTAVLMGVRESSAESASH